jgi:nucleolar protein 16
MARSRRRYKKSRPKVQVALPRVKPHVFMPAFTLPLKLRALTSGNWDETNTIIQNYRSFGVASNPNLIKAISHCDNIVEVESLQKSSEPNQLDEDNDDIKDPKFQVIDNGSDLEEDDLKSALGKIQRDGKNAPLQRLTTMQHVYVG